jgi:hypothetical protein
VANNITAPAVLISIAKGVHPMTLETVVASAIESVAASAIEELEARLKEEERASLLTYL